MMKKIASILLGCFVLSIGVLILRHSHLITGGTVGLSLSFSYIVNLPFTYLFFLVNIPFYIFSFIQMGWKFTVSTIFAVTALSLITSVDQLLPAFSITPLAGAVIGGIINGFGLSILFLNKASLGGSNILALFLQKKCKWNPGKTNFVFDCIVVISGIYFMGLVKGIISIISIAFTSSIISFYKKKIAASMQREQDVKSYKVNAKVVANEG
ncbi:YitT family protein [Niallia sp. 03133]|uniref:YitT family protein n=1 Tax=Niallia sp. 03133 TaxID=3458060 RepID=UPI00404447CC